MLLMMWVAPGLALGATPRYVAADAHIDHYEIAANQAARSTELVHAAHVTYAVRELAELIILVIVLRLGLATRLARWAERRTSRPWLQTLIVAALVLATVAIANLLVELALYGLAWPEQTAISVVEGTLVASALYAIIRRFPRGWWWRAGLLAIPLVVGAPIAAPELEQIGASRLVERDPRLVDRIEELAQLRGVSLDRDRIFVLANPMPDAHATGIGPWRAVFVNDGALVELTDRELGFLLAHEIGHFYGPAFELAGLASVALALAALLAAVAAGLGVAVRRCHVETLASPASLPLGLLVVAMLGIAITPIRASVQRHIEHQADANGLELLAATEPDARQVAAHELQRIGEIFGMPPHDGVIDLLCGDDHPAIGDRIAFVLDSR